MAAKEIQLKTGQVLFEEGDPSNQLYFLKKGIVRIFKRKKEGNIELDTIRAGSVLGELAFLDGQNRSASAEAITACELVEISRDTLDETFTKLPEWLTSLTKTVSARLRTANTRIRQLEAMSTEYSVDKHGNRSKEYTYINISELLRFSTALLVVSARYGKMNGTDVEFSQGLLERFSGQVLQVPSAKVLSLIETFKVCQLLKGELLLTDLRFMDLFIHYVNEQNLLPQEKRQKLSQVGFRILSLIQENRATSTPISEQIHRVNLGPALKDSGMQPSQLQELFDNGFVRNIVLNSAEDVSVDFDISNFSVIHRTFWLFTEIEKLNEQKRKANA